MKPMVFIASSSHQSRVLDAIAEQLRPVAVPSTWIDGQKELGVNILDWVASKADECDFGVCLPLIRPIGSRRSPEVFVMEPTVPVKNSVYLSRLSLPHNPPC